MGVVAGLTMGGIGYAAGRAAGYPVIGTLLGGMIGGAITGAGAAGFFDCCDDLDRCDQQLRNARFP